MPDPQARRVTRELTPEEQERLRRHRELIAAELPDLTSRDQMRKDAREETALRGELRRATHARRLSHSVIAERVGTFTMTLDECLTDERMLRRDVLDRLGVVGCALWPRSS